MYTYYMAETVRCYCIAIIYLVFILCQALLYVLYIDVISLYHHNRINKQLFYPYFKDEEIETQRGFNVPKTSEAESDRAEISTFQYVTEEREKEIEVEIQGEKVTSA